MSAARIEVSYRLSEAATVSFTVEKKGKGKWRPLRKSHSRAGGAGTRTFRLGRTGVDTLRPGLYRLVARARDESGARTSALARTFRIRGGRLYPVPVRTRAR